MSKYFYSASYSENHTTGLTAEGNAPPLVPTAPPSPRWGDCPTGLSSLCISWFISRQCKLSPLPPNAIKLRIAVSYIASFRPVVFVRNEESGINGFVSLSGEISSALAVRAYRQKRDYLLETRKQCHETDLSLSPYRYC